MGVVRRPGLDSVPVTSTWPCPACDRRHPVSDSVRIRVRNRTGPSFERDVCVCAGCVERLLTPSDG
jgi:hypothetical protein